MIKRRKEPEFYRKMYTELIDKNHMLVKDFCNAFNSPACNLDAICDTFDSQGLFLYTERIMLKGNYKTSKFCMTKVVKPFFDHVPEVIDGQ